MAWCPPGASTGAQVRDQRTLSTSQAPTLTLLTSYFVTGKAKGTGQDIDHLDFKIGVEPKDSPPFTVILVASSRQEKAAWTSDISQVSSIACSSEHIVPSCLAW